MIYAATKYLARLGVKKGEDEIEACDKAISYIQKHKEGVLARRAREEKALKYEGIDITVQQTLEQLAEQAECQHTIVLETYSDENEPTSV